MSKCEIFAPAITLVSLIQAPGNILEENIKKSLSSKNHANWNSMSLYDNHYFLLLKSDSLNTWKHKLSENEKVIEFVLIL